MDGIGDSCKGVTVIAATNRLDTLDDAVARPGRFGAHICVGPPTTPAARSGIVRANLPPGLALAPDAAALVAEDGELGRTTDGLSGAALFGVAENACMRAQMDFNRACELAAAGGRAAPSVAAARLERLHLLEAVAEIRAQLGLPLADE